MSWKSLRAETFEGPSADEIECFLGFPFGETEGLGKDINKKPHSKALEAYLSANIMQPVG